MRKTENIINRTGINKTECKKNGHSKENKIPGVKCTPKIELYLSNFKGALHWWNGSLFFLIIILGITLGIFAGCKNIFVPEPPATPEAAGPGGGVKVTLRLFTGSARSVMPGMEALTWEITASQGDITISVADGTYPKFSLSLPVSGTWTFTVRGINSAKDEIFTGSAEQNIESGSTVSISIPLSPGSGMKSGTGTIYLTMTVPANVTKVKYKLDGESGFSDLTLTDGSCSLNKAGVSAGPHTLSLYFLDERDTTLYMCTEAVNVWNGVTSNQWIKTSDEEYINDSGEFVITGKMVNKFVKTMGSVVYVDANVKDDEPATGSIFAPVNSVSTAVDILRKANPGGNYSGTIMVSGATTIEDEIVVNSGETLTIKGTGADASITNDKDRVFNIASGGSLTLGENITLTGIVTDDNGGAVYVNGGTFTMKAGSKITRSSAQNGGGVYVNGGEFEMNGTATLQGNKATTHGGGVHIFSDGTFTGTFTMNGGTIDGTIGGDDANTAEFGGGVFVSGGTFTMNDGTISGNTVAKSGGGVCVYKGIFTMNDGTIGGISEVGADVFNYAGVAGGGVYVGNGTFTMNGGSIHGNESDGSGGGIYLDDVNAKVTLNNTSSISGNQAVQNGGGVFVQDGTFDMKGSAVIQGNKATSTDSHACGGGVYVNDGNFTMAGGTIGGTTPNIATYGGGVHVFGGTFTVSGSRLTITGNTAHNVYLASGNTITIGDKGLTGGIIGVTAESVSSGNAVPITDEDVTGADGIFTSDVDTYSIVEYKGAVYLSGAETKYVADAGSTETLGFFKDAIDAVNNSADGGTITLLKDIDGSNAVFEDDSFQPQPITFYSDDETRSFILDLNGKTIDRKLSTAAAVSDGSVIKIEGGTLTIKDSSATNSDGTNGTGTITGGNTKGAGGGIHITCNPMSNIPGSLILVSGNISGNTADNSNGGGIYIASDCALTMQGGSIDGNTVKNSANSHGGGVFVGGIFTMENGIITKNSSELGNGGGVNIGSNGTFTMSDGTISDNDAGMTGGGVNLGASGATMTLEDGTISGNTATMNGGGVGVSTGDFTMSGGTLSGNTATSGNGGGVYVNGTNSNFIMTGGTIGDTEPNTADLGGGVYVSNSGRFDIGTSIAVSSPVISGNTKTGDSPNNVYLDNGKTLFINGILKKTGGSGNIGISMATPGVFTSNWSSSDLTNTTFFFSDDTQYNVKVTTVNGQDELYLVNSNLIFVKGESCTLNGTEVTLSSFWISPYEVTQYEYLEVMLDYDEKGYNSMPSSFPGDYNPVESVSWYDAIVFCNFLSMQENLTPCYTIKNSTNPIDWGIPPDSKEAEDYDAWAMVTCDFNANGYRLPTEAEWEYAARGGQTGITDGSWEYEYSGSTTPDDVAWYSSNSESKTHEVGTKAANVLGLYDMSGNVFEWCWDWINDNIYPTGNTDPIGNDSGTQRVLRGGSWMYISDYSKVSYRFSQPPTTYLNNYGFRVVRSAR